MSLAQTAPPLQGNGRLFQRQLIELMLRERRLLTRLSVAALVGALLGLALPYASQVALDDALPNAAPRLLVVVALASLLMIGHQAWATWTQETTALQLGANVERSALAKVMTSLVRSDLATLSRHDSGWAMATLRGASSAAASYVSSFATLLTRGAFSLAYLAILTSFSSSVAAAVLASNLAIGTLSYALVRTEERHARTALDRSSLEQSRLHLLLSALPSLRGSFASERLGQSWGEDVRSTGQASALQALAAARRSVLTQVGEQALATGVMVWAVVQCFDGALSIGNLVFVLSISAGLSTSILSVTEVAVGFRALLPQFERVNQLLSNGASPAPSSEPLQTDDYVRIDGMSFRHEPGAALIFTNYDWSVPRGDTVHLQAASGTGKTTLLRMIAGLVAPTEGRVTVFGVDAARARDLVLYVPQQCQLFEGSILENLSLLSGANDDEIQRASELTGLADMLTGLPMAGETSIAAGGRNLSSGQRQLIVLTAAFASSKPVLLLDEATSQIDLDTRRKCRWDELTAGRTVIRVEHG